MPIINITILNVTKTPAMSKANKPYEFLDIAFKNNTWQGKVEGRKQMPYGANAGAFAKLKDAVPGQTYNITVVKGDSGFNDWTDAALAEAGSAPPQETSQVYQPKPAPSQGVSARVNTFESPEERAKKQLSITRLATLNTAVAALSPGAKSGLKESDIFELAKKMENYVYDIQPVAEDASGFDNMDSDIPD